MSGLGEMVLNQQSKEETFVSMKNRTARYDEMESRHDEMSVRYVEMTQELLETTNKYREEHEQNENIRRFFHGLFVETSKPHYGEQAKSIIAALLLRAQEAGVYAPPEKA